jgi:hypothetical protein
MRISIIAVLTTVGLAVVAGRAGAQQNQSGFTPQQLDEMSKQRQEQIGPRNWGPPPPQSSIPKEALRQPSELLVCMSADPWKPVYAEPSSGATVIGKTLPQVAVSGRTINGFVPVLFGPGRTGYVSASEVRPFKSDLNPNASCTISGLRPNGSAVFNIH